MTRLDAETDGGTVAVTLTADDLDRLELALEGYEDRAHPREESDAAHALRLHLRTIRAALP